MCLRPPTCDHHVVGIGPITIYDKSALQALSMDEAVWLDAFFLVNIVPLFYVETLADLEKAMKKGKSPEDLVGLLATKTPPGAVPNVHHRSLVYGELMMSATIVMDGRPVLGGGDTRRTPDGKSGWHVEEFDEAVALRRWQTHDFLDIERQAAKRWREELADPSRERTISIVHSAFPAERTPNLPELKKAIDEFCDNGKRDTVRLALGLAGVGGPYADQILERWEGAGGPPLSEFAPYASHVFKVDLLYYVGVGRGLISGQRASNKADLAYLYYLPFCMVFTSNDRLHRATAPLFLREDQSFVWGDDLKSALHELDGYYDQLPAEIKALGVMKFAHYPPAHLEDNLVVELWDKHMKVGWRDDAETPEEVLARWNEEGPQPIPDEILASMAEATPETSPADDFSLAEHDYVLIRRQMPARKGKWRLLPERVTSPLTGNSTPAVEERPGPADRT